jgi:hypothetical protein
MATLGVESIEQLNAAVAALRAVGLTDDHIAVATLLSKIERNQGQQRAWLVKVEEVAAILNAKVRRVRSKEEAEKSYDHGKLLSELPSIKVMLEAAITSAAEYSIQ